MIFPLVANLANKNYSFDSLNDSLKSISISAKEKILWVFWFVKLSVSNILEDNNNENITNNDNYSKVSNYKVENKIVSNDSSYNISSNHNEVINEKITWVYKYTNTKWKSFGLKIVDSIIQNIISSDWKKVSHQQKSAVQRLLNKNKLTRFQLLQSKPVQEKRVVPDVKPVVQAKPVQEKSSVIEIKPFLEKKSSVKPEIHTQNTVESKLTEQEVTQRVKVVVDRLVDADKRNKGLIDVYARLKTEERWLFANNSSQQLNVAKKVIKDLSQIIPKTNQKVTNIQVNTSLLDRVINGISIYLEKTWLENPEAEKSRDLLLNMLKQSKYILHRKLSPKKVNTWRVYEAIYA